MAANLFTGGPRGVNSPAARITERVRQHARPGAYAGWEDLERERLYNQAKKAAEAKRKAEPKKKIRLRIFARRRIILAKKKKNK